MSNVILTRHKKYVDPLHPHAQDVDVRDIAHALSLLCRANGHFRQFYSVGQHSVNCCLEAKARGYTKRVQLACLMHDASEAYLADITTPVKDRLPQYQEAEAVWMDVIYGSIGLGALSEEEKALVRRVDKDVLYHEFIALMGVPVNEEEAPVLEGQVRFEWIEFAEVETYFINLFHRLQMELFGEIVG